MPSNTRGSISSEYIRSFGPIATAQKEYSERFTFRMQKRDKEYCHQPFLWDSGDEMSGRYSDNNMGCEITSCSKKDAAIQEYQNYPDHGSSYNLLDTSTQTQKLERDQCQVKNSVKSNENCSSAPIIQKSNSPPNKVTVGTQTDRPIETRPKTGSRKAFVPYALGSFNPCTGEKLTFNVKSGREVYPSAIRADVRRRERWATTKCDVDAVPAKSGDLSNTRGIRNISQTNASLSDVQFDRDCSSTKAKQPTEPSLGNPTNWLSEYHQNYPVYPASIYVRSASMAASRCRPFSASSTHRAASRTTQSVVPRAPVLLSSRSSKTSNPKATYGEPCDVCYLRSARSNYPAEILSAL